MGAVQTASTSVGNSPAETLKRPHIYQTENAMAERIAGFKKSRGDEIIQKKSSAQMIATKGKTKCKSVKIDWIAVLRRDEACPNSTPSGARYRAELIEHDPPKLYCNVEIIDVGEIFAYANNFFDADSPILIYQSSGHAGGYGEWVPTGYSHQKLPSIQMLKSFKMVVLSNSALSHEESSFPEVKFHRIHRRSDAFITNTKPSSVENKRADSSESDEQGEDEYSG